MTGTPDNELLASGQPGAPQAGPSRRTGRNALFASVFLIELGSSVTTVALPLLLLDRFGLSTAAGLAFAARLIPAVLLGPVVGAAVAHRDPRRIAVISALCGAVFISVVPWTQSLWQIQLLGLGIGACHMFAGPARLALRTRVLEEGKELAGNGLLVTVERLPTLVGPPLVALLYVTVGFHVLFLSEAAAGLLAAALILLVPDRRGVEERVPADAAPRPGWTAAARRLPAHLAAAYRDSARGMAAAVVRDRFLFGLTLTGFTYVAAVSMGRLFLLRYADEDFGSISGFYGYLLGAMGLGAVAGGIVVGWLNRVPNGVLYVCGNVAEGIAWLVVVHTGSPVLALVLLFFAGITESTATAVFFAEAQKRLPEHLAGHCYAALVPLSDACGVAGALLGGAVAAASLTGAATAVAALIAVPVLLTTHWYLPRARDAVTPDTKGDAP